MISRGRRLKLTRARARALLHTAVLLIVMYFPRHASSSVDLEHCFLQICAVNVPFPRCNNFIMIQDIAIPGNWNTLTLKACSKKNNLEHVTCHKNDHMPQK
jgi:hypothetical protein